MFSPGPQPGTRDTKNLAHTAFWGFFGVSWGSLGVPCWGHWTVLDRNFEALDASSIDLGQKTQPEPATPEIKSPQENLKRPP